MRRVLFLVGLVCLTLVVFAVTGAPQTQQATNPAAGVLKSDIMTPRAALDGTFTTIDVPGAVSTACNAVDDDNSFGAGIVGRFTSPDGVVHAFIMLQGFGFGAFDYPEDGVNFTSANGIAFAYSSLMAVVGSFDANGGGGCLYPGSGPCRGFDLDQFGFYELPPPPGAKDLLVLGMAVGSPGFRVGAYTDLDGVVHGWADAPGFRTVDPPGATLTFATGVLPLFHSTFVVGRWDTENGVTHGYRHHLGEGDFESIDVLGALFTVAHGINRDGVVVGEYRDEAGSTHGFVFEAGGFTTVDFPNATATMVKGISTGGKMVGVYTDADGIEHGFMYTPNSRTPESRTR